MGLFGLEKSLLVPLFQHQLYKFFQATNVPFKNARYTFMNTTNANSQQKEGLTAYIEYTVLMCIWITCTNHKTVICFNNVFPTVTKMTYLYWTCVNSLNMEKLQCICRKNVLRFMTTFIPFLSLPKYHSMDSTWQSMLDFMWRLSAIFTGSRNIL